MISLKFLIGATILCNISCWCYSNESKIICNNYSDYPLSSNENNCWYNPDLGASPETLAENHGCQLQRHRVITSDNYVLTVFRVQDEFSGKKRKQPILLHHGFTMNGLIFITSGDLSLGFYLAKKGYDVWISNHRGTTFSKGHTFLNHSDPEYWDFSFHEIALHDLPATLEYVNEQTDSKIIYIGHSMGTTIAYIYSSLNGDHADKYLKGIIAMCPFVGSKGSRFPLLPFFPILKVFAENMLRHGSPVFLKDAEGSHKRMVRNCVYGKHEAMENCMLLFMITNGNSHMKLISPVSVIGENRLIRENLIVSLSLLPDSTSVRVLLHFLQLGQTDDFQYFDYGEGNMKFYNQTRPPIYPLSQIRIPIHMIYGSGDLFITTEMMNALYEKLKMKHKSLTQVPLKNGDNLKFGHLDFLMSDSVARRFYKNILMKRIKLLETSV